MSDKFIDFTADANDEDTDEPLALAATVDFLARGDVYFTLLTRPPVDDEDGYEVSDDSEILRRFYIPNAQAREMAEFILREVGQ